MGVLIPQVVCATESGASGAQVIDGSLKFDKSKTQFLEKTFSSAGNRKTWTWSGWFKRGTIPSSNNLWTAYNGSTSGLDNFGQIYTDAADGRIVLYQGGGAQYNSEARFRDHSGWYHIVISCDVTQSTYADRFKIYVNGVLNTSSSGTIAQNTDLAFNNNIKHYIGTSNGGGELLDGNLTQVYFIDGQALGPESFGFTDPLTNTWRPKKYTGSVNTPVSFSNLAPILNTNSDGSAVTSGTRTDSNNSNWILGLAMNTSANIYTDLSPSDGDATDYSNVTASTTQSKYYGTSAYFNGSNAKLIVNDSRFNFSATNFTMETWIYVPSTPSVSQLIFCSSNPDLIGSSSTAGVLVGWNSSNQLFVYVGSDNVPSITNSAATAVSTGKWHHIAIVKNGGTITLYIDGSASGTTSSSVGNSTSGFYVAHQPANNRWLQAYYQDIRVYTTAKYTSNFSLPAPAGVNGFYLPMDGNSPIGHDLSNPNPVNNGTVWSSSVTGTPYNANRGGPTLFDGGDDYAQSAYPGVLTWTPPGGQAFSTLELEVYRDGSNALTIVHAGGTTDVSSQISNSQWYKWTVTGITSPITSISWASTSNSSYIAARAVYIDGVELIDGMYGNGWTPVNFGGSVALPKATGALPILNTDGGGNVARVGVRTDANAANLVLALPLVGSSADVSNSVNSGSTTKVITAVGGAAASSAQSNFYGGSFVYDGSGDALKSTSSGLTPGTSDFCCEGWFYYNALPSSSAYRLLGNVNTNGNTTDWQLIHATNGTLTIWNGSGHSSLGAAPLKAGCWNHIAYVRDGATHKLYVNGVQMTTKVSRSGHDLTFNGLDIGGRNDGAESFNGYIQDVRFYIGTTKYTSNFIPASTSPDILPDTPSGVSGGSKLDKVTDGAVAFDGSGDYLSVGDNADFELGSGDFTIEFYAYPKSLSSDSTVISKYSSSNRSYLVWMNSTTVYFTYSTNGSSNAASLSVTYSVPLNKWTHFAMVRDGSTLNMFIDGTLVSSPSISGTLYDGSSNLQIGRQEDGAQYYWNGYISSVRLVKGTALYTSNFTPPTRELTNVTNTKLLCCQSNTLAAAAAVVPGASGINNGTVWSSNFSGNSLPYSNYAYSIPNAFDGGTSTFAMIAASNGDILSTIVTLPGLTSGHSVEFYAEKNTNAGNLTFNGSVVSGLTSSAGWVTAGNANGTSDNFVMNPNPGQSTSDAIKIYAVRVNGIILVDLIKANGNTFRGATTFNPFTTDINAVRGQETGYCTMNPLDKGSTIVLSNGNLVFSRNSGGWANSGGRGTFGVSSGKYYWEFVKNDSAAYTIFGVAVSEASFSEDYGAPNNETWSYISNSGNKLGDSYGGAGASYGASFTAGDAIGVALDADTGTLSFYKNGVNQGIAFSTLSGKTLFPHIAVYGATDSATTNFGQKPFKFPPPAGFQPLNLANIRPETVITHPDKYVGATLWTGNDTARTILTGNAPDFVWIKQRNNNGANMLFDSVRGATKRLVSNQNLAEGTVQGVTSFNSDGFNLGNDADCNWGGKTTVGWTWRAGGSKGNFNVDDVGYENASDVGMNVGGQNSNAYDQTRTWSNSVAADGGSTFVSNQGPTKMFNGVAGMGVEKTELTSNGSATFTSPVQLSGNLRMFIACGSRGSSATGTFDLKLDGVSVFNNSTFPNNAGAWVDFGTKTWTTLQFGTATGGNWLGISAIEVAGKLLVDNGVSVTNAPSIANAGASVGTKQGFSIIKFTNTTSDSTQSHGLTQKPDFIIWKKTSGTSHWGVYHSSLGATKVLYLNLTNAASTGSEFWNNTEPTNSLVTTRAEPHSFGSAGDTIMYVWHNVPGLQKFGSCKGSGASAAPDFVELGFKPSIVWVKRTDNTGNWTVWDSTRNTFNPSQKQLFPNTSGTEQDLSVDAIDILSNGFAIRSSSSLTQTGSQTYIYCAWAEAPTVNLFGAQSNAR